MDWMRDYYRETIETALEEGPSGGELTPEQVTSLVDAVLSSIEHENTMSGADCIPDPAHHERREVEELHKREIASLQREVDAYRSSVAARRHVDVNEVYVDNSGDVIYGKG